MPFLNIKACQHILLHQIIIFKIASYDPFKKQGGKMTHWQHYLPPIFEEVFPKNILSGVLMVQHFCEEGGHFLCTRAEFHVFS